MLTIRFTKTHLQKVLAAVASCAPRENQAIAGCILIQAAESGVEVIASNHYDTVICRCEEASVLESGEPIVLPYKELMTVVNGCAETLSCRAEPNAWVVVQDEAGLSVRLAGFTHDLYPEAPDISNQVLAGEMMDGAHFLRLLAEAGGLLLKGI